MNLKIWKFILFFTLLFPVVSHSKETVTEKSMCEGRVKVRTTSYGQSLPPQAAYIRASDGAQIAWYNDWGANIDEKYFDVGANEIKTGAYTFDEDKFCKYLKTH
jgi:hypothetical protein